MPGTPHEEVLTFHPMFAQKQNCHIMPLKTAIKKFNFSSFHNLYS